MRLIDSRQRYLNIIYISCKYVYLYIYGLFVHCLLIYFCLCSLIINFLIFLDWFTFANFYMYIFIIF